MKSFFLLYFSFFLFFLADGIFMNTDACNPTTCQLPKCYCPSMNIPGNLSLNNTPQFVLFTLDDSMYESDFINMQNFSWILNNPDIKDSLGCTVKVSWYAMEFLSKYNNFHE